MKLVRPLDVEWIWVSHILALKNYRNNAKSMTDTILDHTIMMGKDRLRGINIA